MSKIVVKDLAGPASSSNKIYIASGSELDIANSTGTINLAVDAGDIASGTLANARLATGHILQVVQTTFTGMFESTSTSYTAVTGMSASITPSSTSSKVLIIVQSSAGNTTSTANSSFTIYRGSTTALYEGAAAGSRKQAGAAVSNPGTWNQAQFSLVFLDSPSTTSATTYNLYGRASTGTFRVNANGEDGDATNQWRAASSITVMELKA